MAGRATLILSVLNSLSIHTMKKYLHTKKNSPTWKEVLPLIKRFKRESHWVIGRGDIPMSHFNNWLDYKPPKTVGNWTLKDIIHDPSKRNKFLELYPAVVRGILPPSSCPTSRINCFGGPLDQGSSQPRLIMRTEEWLSLVTVFSVIWQP
ncbi:hypothetical protein QQ045_011141 [Rhodiola kirilowii]